MNFLALGLIVEKCSFCFYVYQKHQKNKVLRQGLALQVTNNSTCFLQLTFAFFAYAQEKEVRYLHMSFRKITKDLHPNKNS